LPPALRELRGGALLGLALALVVMWPGWLWAPTRFIGMESTDAWTHAWGMQWVLNSLLDGRFPGDVDGLAFPRGGSAWYVDPLGAMLAMPWLALGFPSVGYQFVVAIQLVLASAAGWAWGRALGGSGWLAAVACATSPSVLCEYHNGILEAAWVGFVPLAAWAAWRGERWTGAVVGLAMVASLYHGVGAALLAGGILLVRGRFRLLGGTAALAGLVAAPVVFALWRSLSSADSIEQKPTGIQIPTLRINAVDPIAFVHPGDFWTVRLDRPDVTQYRRTPYLGLGLLGLAGVGLARRPRRALLLLPVAGAASLALGPYLWRGDDFARTADGRMIALPMRWILERSPVGLDHPVRFLGAATTALAGLAAPALGPWGALVAPLLLAENLALAPNTWPFATADARLPGVYGKLPADGRAIIDLPADRGDSGATQRYLYWQSRHRHPIPYVLKVSSRGMPSMNSALRHFTALGSLHPPEPGTPGAPDPDADLAAAARELAEQGFGWVILHPELLYRPEMEPEHFARIDPVLGQPTKVAGAWVWELR
jgi:hypothetical protein